MDIKLRTSPHISTPKVQFIEIGHDSSPQRIDNLLFRMFRKIPKSLIYRILRKGEVRVNKKRIKASYKVKVGDIVRVPPIHIPSCDDTTSLHLSKKLLDKLKRSILFEDTKLVVIDKPSGIAVHGGSGLNFGIIEAFRQISPDYKNLELVHRLDRETSGLLMMTKSRSMLRFLHEALRNNKVQKHYLALVQGTWRREDLRVSAPLVKNNLHSGERLVEVNALKGKESITCFRILNHYGSDATLMAVTPITGRTHQIRVHALHMGHCIIGDKKYCKESFSKNLDTLVEKRLFLHAHKLNIPMPDGKSLFLEAPIDEIWRGALEGLSKLTS